MAYNRDSSLPVLWSSRRCDAEEESSGEAPCQEDIVRGEVREPLEAAPVNTQGCQFGDMRSLSWSHSLSVCTEGDGAFSQNVLCCSVQ